MVNAGIEQIFNSCLYFFQVIYAGGIAVFEWFSTPISATGDEIFDVLLGDFIGMTPFELSLGVGLSLILFMALFRFLRGVIS